MAALEAAPRGDLEQSRSIPERSERGWVRWTESLKLAVLTRAVLVAVAYAAAWYLARTKGPPQFGLLDLWSHWDAGLLARVAQYGYTDPHTDPHATAFFPLFPLLERGFSFVLNDPILAGLVISFASSVVACAYLFRMAEEEMGRGAGRRAILYLLLFPTTVFLIAPYTEALFLAGAIPAFYYARRSRWGRVGLPAAVAMGARFAGAFVLMGLAVEFIRQRNWSARRIRDALTALTIGAFPLLAYGAYLWGTKGSSLYFFTDQRLGWGRRFVGPVASFEHTWSTWNAPGYPTNWIFAWRIEIVAAATGAALVAWALAKREWGFAAYMGTFMATLITSTWYYSIPRMLLSFFPAVLFLASWTKLNPNRHEGLLLALAPLATLGVVVFTQGAWFY
jgi:hypothetical protein